MDFEEILQLASKPIRFKEIPKYPAIERDLSLLVDDNIPWVDIENIIKKKAAEHLEEVCFVGIYKGKGIPSEKKSVTLSLRYRDDDGTLKHQTVDGFVSDIVENLKTVGAELRTF